MNRRYTPLDLGRMHFAGFAWLFCALFVTPAWGQTDGDPEASGDTLDRAAESTTQPENGDPSEDAGESAGADQQRDATAETSVDDGEDIPEEPDHETTLEENRTSDEDAAAEPDNADTKDADTKELTNEDVPKDVGPGEVVVEETPVLAPTEEPTPPTVTSGSVLDGTTDPRAITHPRGGFLFMWDTTRPRWFVSARADVGYLFIRPGAAVGYGIPHSFWAGLDLAPILTTAQWGGYAGLHFRHPRVEFRSGILYSSAFTRGSFPPQEHYDQRDLDLRAEDPIDFFASDSEVEFSIPIKKTYLSLESQVLYMFEAEGEDYLFVDSLGVMVDPPWIFRQRIAHLFPVPTLPGLFIGPAVEGVLVPQRSESFTFRAGFLVGWRLYQDLDVRTEILPTIVSPDILGRTGSPWLTITARFSWATD